MCVFLPLSGFATLWSSAKERAETLWKHYKLSHYLLVGSFFVFHVLLAFADVVTDLVQAEKHWRNGNHNWAMATVGFVMVSWLGCTSEKNT